MIESVPAKPKRTIKTYPADLKAKVVNRLAKGERQQSIADDLGIPQTTIAQWSINAGLNREHAHSLATRVKNQVVANVNRIASIATADVEALLAESLTFGKSVLGRANSLLPDTDQQSLVSVANAGKVGVSIARQALGLSDSQETVIIRADLVSSASVQIPQSQPVIDITPVSTDKVQ